MKGYLGLRLRHFTKEEDILKLDSATISVNEAPATYAKEVFKQAERNDGYKSSTKNPDVVLVGDAVMGLSYFKGINAGFESSARLVDIISQPHEQRKQGLEDYKKWFEEKYAPGKVKEVEFFSKWAIGALVGTFQTLKTLFGSDKLMRGEVAERTVDLYLGHLKGVQ